MERVRNIFSNDQEPDNLFFSLKILIIQKQFADWRKHFEWYSTNLYHVVVLLINVTNTHVFFPPFIFLSLELHLALHLAIIEIYENKSYRKYWKYRRLVRKSLKFGKIIILFYSFPSLMRHFFHLRKLWYIPNGACMIVRHKGCCFHETWFSTWNK